MGQSTSNPYNPNSPFLQQYTINQRDPTTFLTYLTHKQSHTQYLLRQLTYNDIRDYTLTIQRLQHRKNINHQHLTTLERYDQRSDDQMCSNFYKVYTLWVFPHNSLAGQIAARKKDNAPFQGKDLWSILACSIMGLAQLQQRSIKHQCLAPRSVLMDDTGNIRIVDPISCGLQSNLETITKNRSVPNLYPSPQECDSIQSQKPIINKNPYKNDVFTLAMILLQCGLLQSQQECYLDQYARINFHQLYGNVNRFGERYGEEIKQMIQLMLRNDIRNRPDWNDLSRVVRREDRGKTTADARTGEKKRETFISRTSRFYSQKKGDGVSPLKHNNQYYRPVGSQPPTYYLPAQTAPAPNPTSQQTPQPYYSYFYNNVIPPQTRPLTPTNTHINNNPNSPLTRQTMTNTTIIDQVRSVSPAGGSSSKQGYKFQYGMGQYGNGQVGGQQQTQLEWQRQKKTQFQYQPTVYKPLELPPLPTFTPFNPTNNPPFPSAQLDTTPPLDTTTTSNLLPFTFQPPPSTSYHNDTKYSIADQLPSTHLPASSPHNSSPSPLQLHQYVRPAHSINYELPRHQSPQQSGMQKGSVATGPFEMNTNREIVEGEYVEQHFKMGSRYMGYKLNGRRHGRGKFYYQDGGSYDGEWLDNKMTGYGVLYYQSNKIAYEGNWQNDQFQGKGILYNQNPSLFNTPFDYTNFDQIDQNWQYYNGQFAQDLKNGEGKLMFANGEVYQGGFREDMVEGKGVFTCRDGRKIVGICKENHLLKIVQ